VRGFTIWTVRTSLSAWTAACGVCGDPVSAAAGDRVVVVDYGNGTADAICRDCLAAMADEAEAGVPAARGAS
jgi:hypothetical protein